MARSQILYGPVVFSLLACLTASGCAASPRQTVTIHDSPRGTVYLERIPNDSFQATHPITLSGDTIARALRGIHVRDTRSTLQALMSSAWSPSTPVRAFSDDEADFLAPFIATAFTRATPDQRIGFRIIQTNTSSDSPKDTTSAILFVYGRSLQISLTQLPPLRKQSMSDGPNRHYASDATGLAGRELAFLPKEAQRPDTFRVGETDAPTLVIDYNLLATTPEQPAVVPGVTPAAAPPAAPAVVAPRTSSELEAIKESLAKKDAEVEALKKEMETIKKQINEQQKPAQPKRKSKPATKPAEPSQ